MTSAEAAVTAARFSRERPPKPRAPRGCAAAFAIIESAQLPPVLDVWVRRIVAKLGLWSVERAEIARELVNHCQEALEQGAHPEDLVMELGDPTQSAKMMKKATKRKRPLPWRIARYGFWGTLGAIGLCALIYAGLIIRFVSGSPTIKTDYIAMVNAEAQACDDEQQAWPVLKDIDLAWKLHILDEQTRQRERADALKNKRNALFDEGLEDTIDPSHTQAGIDRLSELTPDHPDHAACVTLVESFAPKLAMLRDAAASECLGMPFTDRIEYTDVAFGVQTFELLEPTPKVEDRGPFIGILFPHLGMMRQYTRPLSFDARVAAAQGDADRVHANLAAMLELSELSNTSTRVIISDLVSIAMNMVVVRELQDHHLGPGKLVMSREHLLKLRARLADAAAATTLSTQGERMMFDDLIQRIYTDDGNGNGRITPEGLKLLHEYASLSEFVDDQGASIGVLGPIALAAMGDRKSQTERYHETMDTLDRVLTEGPGSYHELQRLELEFEYEAQNSVVESPLLLMTPVFSRAVESVFMSRLELAAAVLAIDLELHRLDHSVYPESLDELTRARVPEDIMNPGQPIRYERTDSGFALYSVGEDGDNDNARELRYDHGPRRHSLSRRFPVYHEFVNSSRPQIVVELDGTPRHGPPSGNDGDWILIRVERDNQDKS